MSRWTEAITRSRQDEAKELHGKLWAVGWDNLSKVDRAIMSLCGWFSMENDDNPHQFVDHDFEEDGD